VKKIKWLYQPQINDDKEEEKNELDEVREKLDKLRKEQGRKLKLE